MTLDLHQMNCYTIYFYTYWNWSNLKIVELVCVELIIIVILHEIYLASLQIGSNLLNESDNILLVHVSW